MEVVGTITILFSNLGPDAAVHIGKLGSDVSLSKLRICSAEEVKDAAVVIPWAMVVSYFINAGTFYLCFS